MRKTRTVGNGEGTLYYSETLKRWIYQYFFKGERKSIKQRKNEPVRDFKARVTKLKSELNSNSYIEKKQDTIKSIAIRYINQKFEDDITKGSSYKRECETLQTLEKCCKNFINIPIQKVNIYNIQDAKKEMKNYSQSVIDKMWRLLSKSFLIASSPSIRILPYNIMNDENLRKPTSNKHIKKIMPLTIEERKKLQHVLDYEERNHKYRNIVKMEWITGMRIGEVLARSKDDVQKNKSILHIHNTLTKDKDGKVILGKHTKTYNSHTGIDEGERNFPIKSELKEIIDEQLSNKITNIHNLIFWDYNKNTFITEIEVNSWIRRLNKKYHISKDSLHNHRLRHDRITQWKEAGMDIDAIQYLAGHVEGSNITADVYIDISEEYALSQYEKIN